MQSQPGICLKTYRVPPESERLPRGKWYNALILMVGAEGFEPPTLCSQSRCATRLRYAPILRIVSHSKVLRLDAPTTPGTKE